VKDIVVGEDDSYDEAQGRMKSAIQFHIERLLARCFGPKKNVRLNVGRSSLWQMFNLFNQLRQIRLTEGEAGRRNAMVFDVGRHVFMMRMSGC
jgi:hypothetical protein